MYSNGDMIFMGLFVGVICSLLNLMIGFLWGESREEKRVKAQEKEVEQQKMWKEYLSALKEGKNGR